jgi:hypothetical protein
MVIDPAGAPKGTVGNGVLPFTRDAEPEIDAEAEVEAFPFCCLRCRSS